MEGPKGGPKKPNARTTSSSKKTTTSRRQPTGGLTQGTLHINSRDYENAFVHQSNGGNDINIQGVKDRNGALHGDEVLIANKPDAEWTVLHHRIREHLETEGDANYRSLLKGAKTSDGKAFTFQSSDEDEPKKDPKSPPKIRKRKKTKRTSAKARALHEAVFSDKPWGQTPVLNDKEWVLDDLPSPLRVTPIGSNVIPILSIKNNAPPPTTTTSEDGKPVQILTPDALDSIISDPESGISLPQHIPMVTTFAKPELHCTTSSNGLAKPSVFSLDSLKKEVSHIEVNSECKESSGLENHDTEEGEEGSPRQVEGKKQKRRRKRNPKKSDPSSTAEVLKPPLKSKVLKLPEGLVFDIGSVLKHKLASTFIQKTAYVIKIIKKNHSRLAVGLLKPFPIKNTEFALFSPTDNRVPRMKIPISQAPNDFTLKPQFYASTLFIAKIREWNASKFALGTLVESIGESSSVEAQSKGILIGNGIDESPFSEKVLQCLPPLPFRIPEEEYAKRRDFTQECVFTIDPLTARDLDDALSITPLGEGNFRVGVHIADVSYFVSKDSELDRVASDRATSVYLTDRVVPMLPRELCEDLCSLNPGVPRLTFSVEWVITQEGEIRSTWFGRSIIKSAVKLAYEHAQDMLDDPARVWAPEELPPLSAPWSFGDISAKVGHLHVIASKLREKRREGGALRLDLPKMTFSLNKETGLPNGFRLYEHRHSNKLIEEFMLLANISVANKLVKDLPQLAVLRRHPPPKTAMLAVLTKTLSHHGIALDPSTSKSISASLERYSSDPKKYQLLVSLLTKPMELALYFCSGCLAEPRSYRHFALNIPLYTHFTSPIRRYPDVLVHRLLDAILEEKPLSDWNPKVVHKMADHCNKKRLDARNASQESQSIFFNQFILRCGPVENLDAVVLDVRDYSLELLIVDMALVQRVYLNYLETLESYEYSCSRGIRRVVLKWKPSTKNKSPGISVLTAFSEVKCTLRKQEGSEDKVNAVLLRPENVIS